MSFRQLLAIFLLVGATATLTAGQGKIKTAREPIKDEYLVFLVNGDRNGVSGLAKALTSVHNGQIIKVWNGGVQGFWVTMSAAEAQALLQNPNVRSIEENAQWHESGSQGVAGGDPFWHLDRIDQRSGTDGTFQYCSGATQVYAYVFDFGVKAIDPQLYPRVQTGFNAAPSDGTSPYSDGGSFNEQNPCGEHDVVNAGHGTSVGTLLAGSGVGVSKTTIIVPLRVLNCQGQTKNPDGHYLTTGSLVDALDWVTGPLNTLWDSVNQKSKYPAVANFSIFSNVNNLTVWDVESEVEILVRTLIRGGIVVVVSANNQAQAGHAGNYQTGDDPFGALAEVPTRLSYSSPYTFFGGPERVISAGGTMLTSGVDQRWNCTAIPGSTTCANDTGTNYGLGVDIWAPADNIQSGHIASLSAGTGDLWSGSQYRRPFFLEPSDFIPIPVSGVRTYVRSGTSFSSPIVAGAAARLLSEDPSLFDPNAPSTTSTKVWSRLSASATRLDRSTANLGNTDSPNLFLYIGGVNFKTQPQSANFSGGNATLSSEAVGTGLTYQLYAGHSGDITTPIGSPQASGTFTFIPSATTTYWIRARNTCAADGTSVSGDSAEATITVTCQGVSITAQPTSNPSSISAGSPSALSIGVAGAAPITVQWYTAAGTLVGSGTPLNVFPTVNTTYYAIASNSCGSLQSSTCAVTVTTCVPPTLGTTFTATPSTISAGGSSRLDVGGATGTATLTYLFYRSSDNTLVGTATNKKLFVSPTVTTSYYYKISNSCGTTAASLPIPVTVQ